MKVEGIKTKYDVMKIYSELLELHGPQGWWPIVKRGSAPKNNNDFSVDGWYCHYDALYTTKKRTPLEQFEICIGAILTQNTNWNNVVKAIINLKKEKLLNRKSLRAISQIQLGKLIRPAGYFNQKARKIKEFIDFLDSGTPITRKNLLSVWGIGPETADSILLYAYGKPEFVIDTYTKRILVKKGLVSDKATYDVIKSLFENNLARDVKLFREYHALLVKEAK